MDFKTLDRNTPWTPEENEQYTKLLTEFVKKGLYVDEADSVIYGDITLEEALKLHTEGLKEDLEEETAFVKAETPDEMQKILDDCTRIAKERVEKQLY